MISYRLSLIFFSCLVTITVASEGILGGNKTKIDQFRYQVSVQIPGLGHNCGGGIIADRFILTAAHCAIRNDGLFHGYRMHIVAGTDDLHDIEKPAKLVDVVKISVPSEYNPTDPNKVADIAVLKLKDSLRAGWLNRNVQKLRLPLSEYENFNGKIAKIAGYGWNWIKVSDSNENGKTDDYLRYADAEILSNSECQQSYREEKKIYDKQICAKVTPHDHTHPLGVCNGDTGGPLVVDGTIVVGVLGKNPVGCVEKNHPAVYTRVSKYLNFIRNAMKDKDSNDIITINL